MSENKHRFTFADDFVGYAKIKVIGVGGAGGNAINRMIASQLKGVEFIAINTDAQVLDTNLAERHIQIGRETTEGLGAGAQPEVGQAAMEESRQDVKEAIGSPNLVFITAGMGGGTGTGAAPVVAEIARASGALTVAIVTKPFKFEGRQRMERAERGLEELKAKVDTLITIPNERLLEIVDRGTTLTQAFATADEVLHQATKGISDLITTPGLINCDFADVRTVMQAMGDALMGTGQAEGDHRAEEAARMAISSPLLENVELTGACGVLINVTGGEDMTLFDVNTATSLIYEEAGADANIIFGAVIDPEMGDQMRVTVIATGLGEKKAAESRKAKADDARVKQATPGDPISLFPDERPYSPTNDVPVVPEHHGRSVAADEAPFPDAHAHDDSHLAAESSTPPAHGHTNGSNGNGRSTPGRMPTFSAEDREIPAYMRRLDDWGN